MLSRLACLEEWDEKQVGVLGNRAPKLKTKQYENRTQLLLISPNKYTM